MTDWLLAAYKFLRSFTKRDWTLDDYPVHLRRQPTSSDDPGLKPWVAQVVNWWCLIGLGDTPDEARADLSRRLEEQRAERPLPRPGMAVAMEYASITELRRHGDLAFEFLERVVGISPFVMTDETTLADFCPPAAEEEVHRRAAELYHVDTRGMLTRPLWEVLDRVRREGGTA